ncbi:hypothetical protein AB0F17_11385 [Nonomuraea sp. NPDC026600]|uniref:hypothetical protein n=1 Tax=Nonomuraea sp. NPDC026600 TaxID=3155363 RepID=UPI00340E95A9
MRLSKKIVRGCLALTLSLGAGVVAATPASAEVETRIDVGLTVWEDGYVKGSGSFSNGSGAYGDICVKLRGFLIDGGVRSSIACNWGRKGTSMTFSAPDLKCGFGDSGSYDTVVTAYDADLNYIESKVSNRIFACN